MTQPQDANSILMGSGSPALKFDQMGVEMGGRVVAEPTTRQQTHPRTGIPETWPDGSPKMQVLVQVATNLRDPQRPEDDGTRTLYIKGKELTNAVRQGIRSAGANGIHTGGHLYATWIADGPIPAGLERGPKLYASRYLLPATSFDGVAAPAGQPAAAPAPHYQQPVAQAPVQQYQQPAVQQPVQQYAAPVQQGLPNTSPPAPPGVDPEMWVRLTPAQQQAVAAAQAAQAQPAY